MAQREGRTSLSVLQTPQRNHVRSLTPVIDSSQLLAAHQLDPSHSGLLLPTTDQPNGVTDWPNIEESLWSEYESATLDACCLCINVIGL